MTYIRNNSESARKNREYQRKWLEKNREVQNQRVRANAKKAKQKADAYIREAKSQGCSRCKENHVACIDFHHKDPELKLYTIATMSASGLGIETIKREIEKCILLCSNCHRKLHYEEKHNGREASGQAEKLISF